MPKLSFPTGYVPRLAPGNRCDQSEVDERQVHTREQVSGGRVVLDGRGADLQGVYQVGDVEVEQRKATQQTL